MLYPVGNQTFRLSDSYQCYSEQNKPYRACFRNILQRAAGRADVPPLAAALEECLEALSILQNNQGRSQAAPLAVGRQRTRAYLKNAFCLDVFHNLWEICAK